MSGTKTKQKSPSKNRASSMETRKVMAVFTPEEFAKLEEYSKKESRSYASTVKYFTLQKLDEVRQTA